MVSPNLPTGRAMAEAKCVDAAPSTTEGGYSPKDSGVINRPFAPMQAPALQNRAMTGCADCDS
jgi:hypothetical protein